jgi:D-alanine-D-alanine ligase
VSKLKVGVIFGGRSGEHEVSLASAESIVNAMDKSKYEVVPVYIDKRGQWLVAASDTAELPQAVINSDRKEPVAILGDPTRRGLIRLNDHPQGCLSKPIDVVFPVLHGTYGEDGTIQGLLEMAGVPYVGCGVLASAVGMDKIVMKQLFEQAGLTVTKYEWFLRSSWEEKPDAILRHISKRLGFPVFVKPANSGSSVGINKASNEDQLRQAIDTAALYDRRIIVERAVMGREIEVSVLGNEHPIASLPGEVIPGHEFYDYEDKYIDCAARLIIPAKLPERTIKRIQRSAITAFKAIDGSGLARVDFFLERGSGRVITSEINTMPGFTSISMYPKMWEASGIPYSKLIDRLIELALERHRDRARNLTSYHPKKPATKK